MNLLIAILSSSSLIAAVVSIVSLLLNRKWTKEDREADKQGEIVQEMGLLKANLQQHIASNAQENAKQARRRIIEFADECRRTMKHSEEHFENVLEDIDAYRRYCTNTPAFENSKAVASTKFILDCYDKAKRTNDFI
ncbi:MAG: hypothetical protein IJR17_06775 [Clostridia bacterium]|nr:hypothetical protein [Clostridia bacterium]